MTATQSTTRVECGYCSADVPVNASSDELRAHTRVDVDGEWKVPCRGSGQRAWIYPGNLRPGDEVQPEGSEQRIVVIGTPTVADDSAVWSFQGFDPADNASKIRRRRLRGNALLRLWTRLPGGDA